MTEEGEGTKTESRRPWHRVSRRGWVLIGLGVLLVMIRIALPAVARRVIESQGSKYLEGQLIVENVDLWILSGAAALEGVSLWPDGGAPEQGQPPPAEPPLVAWNRLYANIAWLRLFEEIAHVEEFELDGLQVNIARLQDGTIVLPELRELPDEEEDEPETDDSTPFGILLGRAAVQNAKVRVRDDVPKTPTYRNLELPSVEIHDLAVFDPEDTEPGRVVVNAALGAGTIRVDAQLSEHEGGFAVEMQIDVVGLPLDQMHVHEPILHWTGSSGTLDTAMDVAVDPEARVVARGRVALNDVSIQVPAEKKPALAWRRFAIELNEVDVAQQRVDLARVSLDGGSVLVRPEQEPPLPVLPAALLQVEADGSGPGDEAGETDSANPKTAAPNPRPTAAGPARAGSAPAGSAADPHPPGDETSEPSPSGADEGTVSAAEETSAPADWKIRLAELEVTDSTADLTLPQGAGQIRVGKLSVTDVNATTTAWTVGKVDLAKTHATAMLRTGNADAVVQSLTVTGLSSDPSEPIHVVGRVVEHGGQIDVNATVVPETQALRAELDLRGIELGRYAELSGVSPVRMPTGGLQAALAVQSDGEKANLAGQIAIDDLDVITPDGKADFRAAWKSLALDIRNLAMNVRDPDAPMSLDLVEFQLLGPALRVTLTPEGIVLPTVKVEAEVASPPAQSDAATPRGTPELAPSRSEDTPAVVAAGPAPPEQEAPAPPTAGTGPAPPTADGPPSIPIASVRQAPAEPVETEESQEDADAPKPHEGLSEPVVRSGFKVQTEAVGAEEIAEFAEPATTLPLSISIDRLQIEDGTFRVVDRSVKPTYRGKISDFTFNVKNVVLPLGAAPTDTSFEAMTLDLKAPGEAPLQVRADHEADGIRVDVNLKKLPLKQFNPYVQDASGYTVLHGAASVKSQVLWSKQKYDSDTNVTLDTLDVGNKKGGTLFKDTFGISISAALALLRDVTGKIGLGIPVRGAVGKETDIGIASIVGQAITKAILSALTSPLKMLGAITMIGDSKMGDIAPAPVTFRPGSSQIGKDVAGQVDRIGDVLASTPAVKIELIGQAGPEDVRGLQEVAVLEDLKNDGEILGGLRNLFSGGSRDAIRKALEDGDTRTLSQEDQEKLAELTSEKTVTDEALTRLAAERAEVLLERFVQEDGVPEAQVSIGAPEVSRTTGVPEVRVNLLQRG